MEFNAYFKSIVEQDCCPVVICDVNHIIIYMNPAAIRNYEKRGGASLVGTSLLDCHNERSCEWIRKVADWFAASVHNQRVHTFYNEQQEKDVYMVALRRDDGTLIGYYEKHEYRSRDDTEFYQLSE